ISLRSSPTLPTSLYQSCDLSVGGPSLLTWLGLPKPDSCTGSPRGRTGWGSRACEALGKGMGLGGRGGMGFRSICAIRKVLRSFFLEGTLSSLSLFLDLGLEEGPTRAQEKVATWGCPRDSCQCLQPTSRSLEFGEWG
uniref:Uncharacterized protein n=1 Tax=Pan paniscus TaxID=9597 RepID=A0A2R8ZR20_PANPA